MNVFSQMDASDEAHRAEHRIPPDERADTGERSRFYCAATLKGQQVKPREWLVHGLIPQKTVTLFSGDGGTGKSHVVLAARRWRRHRARLDRQGRFWGSCDLHERRR
ncbi:MAG: AAA family ATPase [Paracoccaceae bacterium]